MRSNQSGLRHRFTWMLTRIALSLAVVGWAAACGDDGPCDPVGQTGCDDGVCAPVEGGDPICTDPVYVQGRVLDLADDGPIEGARVVALDVNRAPQSSVVESAMDGTYSLDVPTVRNPDGSPRALQQVTLRADAAGYQSFPSGVRVAQPVDVSAAVKTDGAWVVASAQTDIGLIGLPVGSGTASIHGRVEVPDDHAGVMVVAETGGAGFDAVADRDGTYVIFNLPPGNFDVAGYARGHVYQPATTTLTDGADVNVDLALTGDAAADLTGSVSIVNGGGASQTSVVLFVESTFDDNLMRGAAPPGLRAPDPGIAPNVSGAFTITGVPPGRYVVLAAFEDDGLVRDPDPCIAGTEIVHITVPVGGIVDVPTTFKITGALALLEPAPNSPVGPTPTFRWEDDSSEDNYQINVYDAFGTDVWFTEIPGVSGGTPSVTYAGPGLISGMYYQVRVTSSRTTGGGGSVCLISTSEDLAGVFYLP